MSKTVAFIPLRKGSQSIVSKNIKELGGKPLFFWVTEAALGCSAIDEIIISTNCETVLSFERHWKNEKLQFFKRSEEFASDEATSESALIEYFKDNFCETVVLIQATSPLLRSDHLSEALVSYHEKKYDSLFSSVPFKRFLWRENGEVFEPVNYDPKKRPRRQDFANHVLENGAFYISNYDQLLSQECRLHGKIGTYQMPSETMLELDDEGDWKMVETLLSEK